jgi:uncharacterized repeat protein (TIGR01451 family)
MKRSEPAGDSTMVRSWKRLRMAWPLGAGLVLLASAALPARAQTISSAANQIFHVGDPPITASPITITDVTGGVIKKNQDIRVDIPATFNMMWDSTIVLPIITGSGAAKISPVVRYESANHNLVINVLTTFLPNDQVVLSGLRFRNFSATSPASNLGLDVKGSGQVTATDPHTIQIDAAYSMTLTPASTSASLLPSNGGSAVATFTLTNTSVFSDSYDLFTTKVPGTALTVASITGTGVTQGANPDSARRSAMAAGGFSSVTVTFRVGNVAGGTIDTLKLRARSVADTFSSATANVIVTVIRPAITVSKSVSPGGNSPPGTDLTFTSTVTNVGTASASSLALVDSIPTWVQFKVASASNTLPPGLTAVTEYSSDGGVTWTYVPASGGCTAPAGYDRCVNRIRWRLQAALASTAGSNQGILSFVSRIR